MISINEAMGFRPVDDWNNWQLTLCPTFLPSADGRPDGRRVEARRQMAGMTETPQPGTPGTPRRSTGR